MAPLLTLSDPMSVPLSCPRPAVFWDTGSISMENKIIIRKLNLIYHIKSLDDSSIAKEIFNEQVRNCWPGLVSECRDLCELLNIPDITHPDCEYTKNEWKQLVKKSVMKKLSLIHI